MYKLIKIRIIPNAKKNEVKKIGDGFKVYITVPPVDNKANKALLEVLARYFDLKNSQLDIIKGQKSRDKVIKINAVQ